MYSKFPLSMENIPRQRKFVCLSLKFGCIFSGIVISLYSILYLAQCMYALSITLGHVDSSDFSQLANFGLLLAASLAYMVTLFLSSVMMVGSICEKPRLMKPWVVWMSMKLIVSTFMFVFLSTMYTIGHTSDFTFVGYVIDFLVLLLQFYMLMLVASFHKEMEDKTQEMEQLRKINNETWYS